MASQLERTIARQRRQIEQREAPVRQSLAAAYDRATKALQADLDRITLAIKQARAAGTEVNPDWLRRQSRYQRLLEQARREFIRFSDEGMQILRDAKLQAVAGGAHDARELMDVSGISTAFDANVNMIATERAVAALQDDSPLREVLDRYGANAAAIIESALVGGIIAGKGPREISRQIMRSLNGEYSKARLNALVRTEMMRAYRGSLEEQYAVFGDRIRGYRRICAHSPRTCLACLALDGQVTAKPPRNFHVCCRCTFSPVGINSTYEYTTGDQWLRSQPPDVQRRMFPTADAYAAYRDNTVTLRDFVATKQSKTWGPSVVERSWRSVKARKAA